MAFISSASFSEETDFPLTFIIEDTKLEYIYETGAEDPSTYSTGLLFDITGTTCLYVNRLYVNNFRAKCKRISVNTSK